jgi:hypothetical protein
MKKSATFALTLAIFASAALAFPFLNLPQTTVGTLAGYFFATQEIETVSQPDTEAASDLFISEYIEGSSSNKAIEIYNGTGASVSLDSANYILELYSNGSPTASVSYALSGTVANGDVWVVINTSATNATILAQADDSNAAVINFNGDDAVILKKGGPSGAIVDSIGQVGFDPGSEWGTGLTSTADNTIVRKSTVCAGDPITNDAFAPAIEWDGFAVDTVSNLGSHTANCTTGTPGISRSPSSINFGNQNVGQTTASQMVTVTNTGTANLVLGTPAFTTGTQFALVSNPNGTSIPPAESASFSITFTPTSIGVKTDTLTITSNASGPAPTVSLTGTGIQTHSISGTVSYNGVPLSGVTMTISGDASGTVTTDTGPATLTVSGTSYANGTATFGPQAFDLSGQLAVASVTDACSAISNAAAGRIVVVDRGTCTYPTKAANVQNAGGIGMLLVNSSDTPVAMDGTGVITIPSLSVGSTDGAAIKALMASGPTSATMFRSGDNYTFAGLTPGGDHTVTPQLSGYSFTPTNRSFTDLNATVNNADFTASLVPSPVIGVTDVNFGNVLAGTTGSGNITVSNTAVGSGPLTISSVTLGDNTSGWFSIFSAPSPGTQVPPNATVAVRCSPPANATGSQNATVTVASDSGAGGDDVSSLSCTAVAPEIEITPGLIDFGDQTEAVASGLQGVTIRNTGTGNLVLGTLIKTGTNAADFTIVDNPSGATIAAGASRQLRVRFTPGAQGGRTAQIGIPNNDADEGSAAVSLSGNGIAASVPAADKAMWVFGGSVVPNPVSDATGRSTLLTRSSANAINNLYVSVYQGTPNSSGRLMYQDADMAVLIAAAHAQGQEVWAAYGDTNWPALGCTASSFPVLRMAEVAAYNASRLANERFDGVMLDVEPSPANEAEFQSLIAHHECMRNSLPSSIKLGTALSAFWDDDNVTYPAVGGTLKPAAHHIIDLDLDSVVVMGYRDTAGTTGGNGIIGLDENEIAYATSTGRPGLILAGLETISGQPDNVTFFEEGQSAMDAESQLVATHFAASTGFGGFAIHNYMAAYLSDTTGWPAAPSAPSVTTNSASSLTGTTATLNGTGNPNGAATTGWFRYSTVSPGTCNDSFGTRAPASGGDALGSGTTGVGYSEGITGLTPATTYFYCAIAQNTVGTSFGSVVTFTTPTAPSVTTNAATSITSTSATLNGQGTPNGATTTAWFRYSTVNPVTCDDTFGTRAPSTGGTALGSGSSPQAFSRGVTGLASGTTYYYCAIAQNSEGTGFGAVLSFTTPGAPSVTTSAASSVTATGATLNGSANPNGASATGWFRYSTTNPVTCDDAFGTRAPASSASDSALGSGTSPVAYNRAVTGLSPATTYYFCAIAENSVGKSFGSVVFFTTPALAPVVTTNTASSITSTAATLNGTANPGGAATTGWFRYSTVNPGTCNDTFGTRAPASGGDDVGSGTSNVGFSEGITGLVGGTTYFYCAIASNSVGTSFGNIVTFTTPTLPSVTTNAATSITSTSATLNGTANPSLAATTGWFRYSTTNPVTCDDTFGTRAPSVGGTALGSGSTPQAYSQGVTGLAPLTTYYYCAIAQNSEGTGFGLVLSFTTPGAPTVTTNPATSVTSSSATLNGQGNPNGAATTGWFRYSTTNPVTCNDTFGTRAPASSASDTVLGSGTTPVGFDRGITGLSPATTYYFCAIASNSVGTSFGSVVSLTTPATAPTVTTNITTAITSSSATLNGTANPNGAATTGWFRYSTVSPVVCNDTFGTRAPAVGGDALGSGTTGVAYNEAITGLNPSTTYFLCAIAQNSVGTNFGTIQQFTTSAAGPVTLVVDNLSDDGALNQCVTGTPNDCSLRGANSIAQDGDTITFDAGLFAFGERNLEAAPQTIVLGGSQLVLTGNITINGPGTNLLTISASNFSRVFFIAAGNTVTISGLTVADGYANGVATAGFGGCIYNDESTLTLSNTLVAGCTADGYGGGIFNDSGTLTVVNSMLISNDSPTEMGGGIANRNTSNAAATLNVTKSTISFNSANGGGGGIYNDSVCYVNNSTISSNSAASGGGVRTASGVGPAMLNIANSTVAFNTSTVSGGGIRNDDDESNPTGIQLNSTIVSDNSSPSGPDILSLVGPIGSYNLVETTTGYSFSSSSDNIFGVDPQLGPLADNGGPTFTHKPAAGFAGHDKGCAFRATTDQRGFNRTIDWPTITDASCTNAGENGTDIGAVELLTPTAANVSISGRVTNSIGRGLMNVIVSVNDSEGRLVKYARTNSFGYFTVFDIPAGASYVVAASSKRYTFEQPSFVVSLDDNVDGLTFVGVLRDQ